jgi:ABC-type branched-subunit amino acid transport system substrate-binding protein
MQTSRPRRIGAVVLGLSLLAASCGDDDSDTADTTAAPTTTEAAPVTTEAATTIPPDTTAVSTEGALAGMKGTTPLPPELSQDFKDRVVTTPTGSADGGLSDFNYAAETYDAVMLIALAVEAADTDGIGYANEIVNVSREGEACSTFTDCKALLDAGTDINYEGVSGPNDLNGNGEPLAGTYGVLNFGADNRIDDSLTENVAAESPESAVVDLVPSEGAREGDGILKIGGLLPQTGALAFLGAPMFAGAELAVADINAAGGVLGVPVEYTAGDSGHTDTDLASQTSDRFLAEGVDAIVGPASSGVALTVIDKITTAGVALFSPANTSPALSTYADKGLYFRNAPPDTLQGAVIADLVVGDGNQSAFIMALDDAYGNGIADVIEEQLNAQGVEVLGKTIYDPESPSFDTEIGEIAAADPDAIILITFEEGSRILKTMVELGIGPTSKAVYGCDGNMGNALGESFDAGE